MGRTAQGARPVGAASPGAGGPGPGWRPSIRAAARIKDALTIEIDRIVPDPDQPRKEFDDESPWTGWPPASKTRASSSRSGCGGTSPG